MFLSGCIQNQNSGKGDIQVTSTPSGAEVYLDNGYRGTSPTTIKDVPFGSHIIELRERNYQIWNTTITVTSESTSYISTKLNPILQSSQPVPPTPIQKAPETGYPTPIQKAPETVYKGIERTTDQPRELATTIGIAQTVPSTTQSEMNKKAQEAVYRGVEQSTQNIQLVGNVYGLATTPANGIDQIKFTIALSPGAPSLDLQLLKIVISEPNTGYIKALSYASNAAADTNFGTSSPTLSPQQQVEISIILPTGSLLQPNKAVDIEIRPATGAAIPFYKLSPATIQKVNVLQ